MGTTRKYQVLKTGITFGITFEVVRKVKSPRRNTNKSGALSSQKNKIPMLSFLSIAHELRLCPLIYIYYFCGEIYYVLAFLPAFGFLSHTDIFNNLSEMPDFKCIQLSDYNKSQSNLKERLFNSNIREAYEVGTSPCKTDLSFK